jgi:hypothetical protein
LAGLYPRYGHSHTALVLLITLKGENQHVTSQTKELPASCEGLSMLAEIFMVRLEVAMRALKDRLPSSTSGFVPFTPGHHVEFKDARKRPLAAVPNEGNQSGEPDHN